MAKRQKKTVLTGVSRDAAEEAFGRYAKADAQIEKINAEIDLACAKVRDKYQVRLGELSAERENAFDVLQSYATENQGELFVKKKSLEMAHGTIGFRTGTPKLKTLRGFTWASALTLVKRLMPGYVRTADEIAKDRLLADRDMESVEVLDADVKVKLVPMCKAMAECGIQVVQEETFYVEPKKEDAGV